MSVLEDDIIREVVLLAEECVRPEIARTLRAIASPAPATIATSTSNVIIIDSLGSNTTSSAESWVQWSPQSADPAKRRVPVCRGVAKRRDKERARAKAARQAKKKSRSAR